MIYKCSRTPHLQLDIVCILNYNEDQIFTKHPKYALATVLGNLQIFPVILSKTVTVCNIKLQTAKSPNKTKQDSPNQAPYFFKLSFFIY